MRQQSRQTDPQRRSLISLLFFGMALVNVLLVTLMVWKVSRSAETRRPAADGAAVKFLPSELDGLRVLPGAQSPTLREVFAGIAEGTNRRLVVHDEVLRNEGIDIDSLRVAHWHPQIDVADFIWRITSSYSFEVSLDDPWDAIGVSFRHDGLMEVSAPLHLDLRDQVVVRYRVEPLLRLMADYDWKRQRPEIVLPPAPQPAPAPVVGAMCCFCDGYDPPRLEGEWAQELIEILTEHVEPVHWVDCGGRVIRAMYFCNLLIVSAPPRVHEQIETLLVGLEEALASD